MTERCSALTTKGAQCRNNVPCRCHGVHMASGKFMSRFSTLVREAAGDMTRRLPDDGSIRGDNCYYCNSGLTKDNRSVDHVIQLVSKSRINPLTNLSNFTVPCCKTCNSRHIGQKNPGIFGDMLKVTKRYKFEREDELNEKFDQLKALMQDIQTIINTGAITVIQGN